MIINSILRQGVRNREANETEVPAPTRHARKIREAR